MMRAFATFAAGVGVLTACSSPPLPLPPPQAADWSYVGGSENAYLGHRVSSAGDVNGDGYGDLVAAESGYDSGRGRVLLWLGSAQGLKAEPDWVAEGEAVGDQFGDRLGPVGDANGDGYDDIFVAAPSWKGGLGRVYVFYGGPKGLQAKAGWAVTPDTAREQFGDCTAPTGDVNGDGYADLLVAAYGHDEFRGRAMLYLGGPQGLAKTPAWTGRGEAVGDQYGYSLGSAGDVNGDGIDDLLIGAKLSRAKAPKGGSAYLHWGGAHPLQAPAWRFDGSERLGKLSYRLYGIGDADADGFADFAVSAPGELGGQGRVRVFRGAKQGPSQTPWFTVDGRRWGLRDLGKALGPAGDFNGDGWLDLLVGARKGARGQALVLLGGPDGFDPRRVWRAEGESDGDQFGLWAAPAGDLNGDGISDIVVSAISQSQTRSLAGKIYVYYGRGAGRSTKNAFRNGYFKSQGPD